MRITLIAAVAINRAIGYDNKLLYHFKEDMSHFKSLTLGNTVIMGRKTFESLPNGALPGRRNIVISKTVSSLHNCDVYHSLEEAFDNCKDNEDIYIIGGESIYIQTITIANRLCLTEINAIPQKADAYFPKYNDWKVITKEQHCDFCFVEYERP